MNFHSLLDTVKMNCEITDARHARNMTMCIYLLEMQQYYRWQHGIPYSQHLPKDELGNWLTEKEKSWNEIGNKAYSDLDVDGKIDPFDSETANRKLIPEGLLYGAGYGRFGKPHFFLGKLESAGKRGEFDVLVSECEYARDLTAPVAAIRGNTIVLRRDAIRRMIWEKWEELRWKGRASPYAAEPDFDAITESACEAVILHEIGEGMAGRLLGPEWEAMLAEARSFREESTARAIRDLLADCLSTLPELIERRDPIAIHFHFEHLSGMRREIFPMAVDAYRKWASDGDTAPLRVAAEAGAEHWLSQCRQFLDRHSRGEALAEDGVAL